MPKGSAIDYFCPRCAHPHMRKTGFKGGRWCSACQFSFTILLRDVSSLETIKRKHKSYQQPNDFDY